MKNWSDGAHNVPERSTRVPSVLASSGGEPTPLTRSSDLKSSPKPSLVTV